MRTANARGVLDWSSMQSTSTDGCAAYSIDGRRRVNGLPRLIRDTQVTCSRVTKLLFLQKQKTHNAQCTMRQGRRIARGRASVGSVARGPIGGCADLIAAKSRARSSQAVVRSDCPCYYPRTHKIPRAHNSKGTQSSVTHKLHVFGTHKLHVVGLQSCFFSNK